MITSLDELLNEVLLIVKGVMMKKRVLILVVSLIGIKRLLILLRVVV